LGGAEEVSTLTTRQGVARYAKLMLMEEHRWQQVVDKGLMTAKGQYTGVREPVPERQ
jgi:hypothetical protein